MSLRTDVASFAAFLYPSAKIGTKSVSSYASVCFLSATSVGFASFSSLLSAGGMQRLEESCQNELKSKLSTGRDSREEASVAALGGKYFDNLPARELWMAVNKSGWDLPRKA